MMNLNEIALLSLIVAPFIYAMISHPIRCERKLNRAERRKKIRK